jgi:hypothetical protein
LAAGIPCVLEHDIKPADAGRGSTSGLRPSNSLRGQIISAISGTSFIMFTTTYGLFVWHNQKYTLLYKL